MTPLQQLQALSNPARAKQKAAYHKSKRVHLGIPTPQVADLVKKWRAESNLETRISITATLWDSDIHEARIAASKLLTQARIRPDAAVWVEIQRWVPQFDSWAIADHACSAGARRLLADPARLDIVEGWTRDENMWVRRAAMVMTLPWSKQNHPDTATLAARERILGWAAHYVPDHDWFIQKSISWWLRSLSRHDPDRVLQFITEHGNAMKPFARRDAIRNIKR